MDDGNPMKVEVKAEVKADLTESANTVTQESCGGVRRLFKLFFGNREADNAYYETVKAAQARRDYLAITSGEAELVDGKVVPVEGCQPAQNQLLRVEQKEEVKNLAGNMKAAILALEGVTEEELPDEDVDPDFIARWRREAKVIGNEALQAVWGRLLAEEVKKPDSVSFRTLDVVKNLTRADAELFCWWAKFVVASDFLPCPQKYEPKPNIFSDISRLFECGLVTTLPGLAKSTAAIVEANGRSIMHLKEHVLVSYDKTPVEVRGTCLTQAGKELYAIADYNPMVAEDYPLLFACVRKNKNIKLHPLVGNQYFHTVVLYAVEEGVTKTEVSVSAERK